jgi:hypothetical protein
MSICEILRHATSPTDQWSADTASKPPLQRQDGYGVDATVPGLQEASVSVCSRSPKSGTDATDPRAQSGVYGQDPLKLGSCFKTDGQVDGRVLKRSGNACPGGFSPKKRRAWLTGLGESRSSCFIASIAWRPRNSFRSIGFWFLKAFNPGKEAERV